MLIRNRPVVFFQTLTRARNDAVVQAEEFHKSVGIDAAILTKVEADVKGGSVLSVTYVTKKPILFIGTGQIHEDLQEFDPERFVQMILK